NNPCRRLKAAQGCSRIQSSMRVISKMILLVPQLALLQWVSSPELASAQNPKAAGPADPSAEFFEDPAVRVLRLELADSAFAALQRQPRMYVAGTFSNGRVVLTNIG